MEEQFIPYNEALLLKELGFNEKCLLIISHSGDSDYFTKERYKSKAWLNSEEIDFDYDFPEYGDKYEKIKIPLWQQAFDWFREEYKLFSIVDPINNVTEIGYRFNISTIKHNMVVDKFPLNREESKYYKKYENARRALLEKLIEIVKNENKSNL